MKIRLLPSTVGADQRPQLLTTFVVDGSIAIDAGSIAVSLTVPELRAIKHVVVTHSHSDHTALLPIFIAEAFVELTEPIIVYATDETITDLRNFVFNDHIWPDFERITMPGSDRPSLEFRVLRPGQKITLGHLTITPIPVNHTVPCVGLLVEDAGASVIFTSDTYTTDEIWHRASTVDNLRAIYVDVSYPNEMEPLAEASRHFTPQSLAADLKKLNRNVEIFAVHIKPTNREAVVRQLHQLGDPRISVALADRTYEW
ncbi:MAG TPA: 3',5'-cyclic-nucleotide phosphodiesterase [Blastocatellia bacterium]